MALLLKSLSIFGVLLALSLEFSSASRLPQVCNCGKEIPRLHPQYISNFAIAERTDRCGTEILLTTNRADVTKVCLDPSKRQGKRILDCWINTIKRDESRKAECLMTPRAGVESRTTESTTGFTVTKEFLFPSTSTAESTATTAPNSS